MHTYLPDCETASAGYARRFSGPVGEYLLQRQSECVQAVLQRYLPGPLRTLEVGGGHAQLTKLFLSHGHAVTVHGSTEGCREGLERNGVHGVDFVVGSLDALPFPPQSFDLVVAFRLLPHIEDTARFLRQLTAIAVRGVIFDYASLIGGNILTPLLFPLKKRIEGNTREYHLHTASPIKRVLAEEGFQVREVKKQFLFPMGLHRAVRSVPFSAAVEGVGERFGLTSTFGSPAIVVATRRGR